MALLGYSIYNPSPAVVRFTMFPIRIIIAKPGRENMASRREKCQWCGQKLLVPLQAQTFSCPYCLNINQTRNYQIGYLYPEMYGNPNRISDNVYNGRNQGGNFQYIPMQVSQPNFHGRKRAVLCGITYKGHPKALKGSVNDVLSMKSLLVRKLGFPTASIVMLTEEEEDPYRVPTKHNIKVALQWLVRGCQSGDSLVFHYSGHGSHVRDRDGDEPDGLDEALCPLDYETEGKILDDEINEIIVRPLPRGARLHAIIDTCFSGTFLDLPFLCRMNREGYYRWEHQPIPNGTYKGTSGGLAISISACDDHQNSGEAPVFTGSPTGALTYSFIQIVERKEARLTYGYLLSTMRNFIHDAQKQLSDGNIDADSVQEPQLSSSEQFEIHSKPFVL